MDSHKPRSLFRPLEEDQPMLKPAPAKAQPPLFRSIDEASPPRQSVIKPLFRPLHDEVSQPPSDTRPIPTELPEALKIVAYVFIFFGVIATIQTIAICLTRNLFLNLYVIHIFTGLGLLRLRSFWRKIALISLWLEFFLCFIRLVALVSMPPSSEPGMGGLAYALAQWRGSFVYNILFLNLALWQYWVLTRPQIRELFRSERNVYAGIIRHQSLFHTLAPQLLQHADHQTESDPRGREITGGNHDR